MKRFAAVLLLLLLCGTASAEIIRAVVSGDNVNLRMAPSSKGKIIARARTGDVFLVHPVSFNDIGDNSTWFKVLYTTNMMNGDFLATEKDYTLKYVPPYVSTRYVSAEPLSEADLRQLEWIKAGKPVAVEFGDDLKELFENGEGYRDSLDAVLELRKNPSHNASIAPLLNSGQKVLTAETLLHQDADGIDWGAVVDAESYKLLGWVELARWEDFPKQSLDPVSPDRPAEE